MAIYNPRLDWLKEELISIQKQTYRDFCVIVWNDNPKDNKDYDSFFKKYLINIPFKIFIGKENLGSNKVFEKLTQMVETSYIVYCDQDDIWMPNKLETLIQAFDDNTVLAFSDVQVINATSAIVANSISDIRPRIKLFSGQEALKHLLVKNFITGCTMMMKTDIAKYAIPFPIIFFHDWWLALHAAIYGRIKLVSAPLMKYRIYDGNQSKPLNGIESKEEYYKKYILKYYEFLNLLKAKFSNVDDINICMSWAKIRISYFEKPTMSKAIKLLRMKKLVPSIVYFELVLPYLSEGVVKKILQYIKMKS